MYELKVLISDEVGKTEKSLHLTVACNNSTIAINLSLLNKTVATFHQPTLLISKVNTMGKFSFKFSEPVGLKDLIKPTNLTRRLKASGGGGSSAKGSSDSHTEKADDFYESDST